MNHPALAEELQKPAYATMTDAEAADYLNAETVPRIVSRFVNIRTMYAEIGPAETETIIAKLTSAAPENAVIARILSWLAPAEGGIDMGHTATRGYITQLHTAGLFTETERDALLALGEERISIAESLGATPLFEHDITIARGMI